MNAVDINQKIIEKIKRARIERDFTQRKLAEELNKTSAAVSDMERGKVQVSAGELYIIAKLLDKPIEYFFGEDFSGVEIQDMIAVTRLQDKATQNSTMEIAKMLMRLNMLNKKISKYEKGADVPNEIVTEFYETFTPFARAINEMARKFDEVERFLDVEIKKRGEKKFKK